MAPSPFKIWWLGIRPKTLTIAVSPVLVGTAIAWAEQGQVSLLTMVVALIGAMLIQAGTNLHNDSADYRKGTDMPGRDGPQRITAEGMATPEAVTRAAYISFGLAALAGCYLIWIGGWPILALGLMSIFAGLAYTGGPKPIAYTALGEIFVFLFFGLGAVMGSHFLQTGASTIDALIAAFAVGLPAAAVLAVNNYRDMEGDAKAGKNTLAVRMGRTVSKWEYAGLLLVPFVLLAPLIEMRSWSWLPVLSLPLALLLIRAFWTTSPGPTFNGILARTALFQLLFALLLSLGLLL